MAKSEFYTLNGYRTKNKNELTESMEDYIEMMYRILMQKNTITISSLSSALNVKPSSVSKMCNRLKEHELIVFEKYGTIFLTNNGKLIGSYLLWRHNTLEKFLRIINQEDFHLEQVEKMEHFIDEVTLLHLEAYLKRID